MNILDFLLLGITAGITPGPMTALIFGETFKGGFKKGLKIPLAIVFSNFIVAPAMVSIVYFGSDIEKLIKVISYSGVAMLLYLAAMEWKFSGELKMKNDDQGPFRKALLMDLTSPYPYIFWLTILAPGMVKEFKDGNIVLVLALFLSFVIGLCGTKLVLITLADKLRKFVRIKYLKRISKVLALILAGFAIKLFRDI